MDQTIRKFEDGLREKVAQKTSVFLSAENVLIRAFKFFDIDESESVGLTEWKKALQKIGVVLPVEFEKVFKWYDSEKTGCLDYKKFVALILNPSLDKKKTLSTPVRLNGEIVLEKVREKLMKSKLGLFGLSKVFSLVCRNSLKNLDFSGFCKVFQDYQIDLSQNDSVVLFKFFEKSGFVNYEEILNKVRGKLSKNREEAVRRAFARLDRNRKRVLDIREVKKEFGTNGHPEVLNGQKSEEQVLFEFLETFEIHHSLSESRTTSIDFEEFLSYYSNISFLIENDEYFEVLLNNSWKSPRSLTSQSFCKTKTVGNSSFSSKLYKSKNQSVVSLDINSLYSKLKKKIALRGIRGLLDLEKLFDSLDTDKSNFLSLSEFSKACKDFSLSLTNSEILTLFNGIDVDKNGQIDYQEFLSVIKGPLNNTRAGLVKLAFEKLDSSRSGFLDLAEVKLEFDAKNLPEVRTGRKAVNEAVNEFHETFENHHFVWSRSSNKVSFEEWEDFYMSLSSLIEDDQTFEKIVKNSWNIPEPSPKKANWDHCIPFAGKKRMQTRTGPPFGLHPDFESGKAKTLTKDDSIFTEFLGKIRSRGEKGIYYAHELFSKLDVGCKNKCGLKEFFEVWRDLKIKMTREEVFRLFKYLDREENGEIDYDVFLRWVYEKIVN